MILWICTRRWSHCQIWHIFFRCCFICCTSVHANGGHGHNNNTRVTDRPPSRVIASILDRDANFVTAKRSVDLFSAQSFVLRKGWVPEQLIFPSVVKKVLDDFSSRSGAASAWLNAHCIVISDCGKLVHVYMNWDVIRKDDFVNFINNVM